jgi:predicted nucleic acid-binding protein
MGIISVQVVQELYVNVRRKARNPVAPAEARRLVEDYLCWDVVVNDADSIRAALDFERRFALSFWDAMIIQAANRSGAKTLYSEDFQHGQTYGSVEAINPFS